MAALTAVSIFYGSDLDAYVSVCTAIAVAGPLLVYWSPVYNFTNAAIVIVSYALCLAVLLIRTRAKKMPSTVRRALRRETQLLSSITLVLALYIVFHVIPTTALKVTLFASLKSSTTFAGAYGVSYGVYSVGSFCAYMWRHHAIRRGVLQAIHVTSGRTTTIVSSIN
ncbi:hypothetical protein AAVH_24404 [Aphelenchoides avenae]|nr:hypothetical protein AAVH_24404 [Aphelenchus avenae]